MYAANFSDWLADEDIEEDDISCDEEELALVIMAIHDREGKYSSKEVRKVLEASDFLITLGATA